MRRSERDRGLRPGPATQDIDEVKALERKTRRPMPRGDAVPAGLRGLCLPDRADRKAARRAPLARGDAATLGLRLRSDGAGADGAAVLRHPLPAGRARGARRHRLSGGVVHRPVSQQAGRGVHLESRDCAGHRRAAGGRHPARHERLLDISAWGWLFVLEALLAFVLAVLFFRYLPSTPSEAEWLSPEEKELQARLMSAQQARHAPAGARGIVWTSHNWLLGLCYGVNLACLYGVVFWLPTMIKSAGASSPLLIGSLSAVPWVAGLAVMLLVAAHVDRRQNSLAVLAVCNAVGLASWAAIPLASNSIVMAIVVTTLAVSGLKGISVVFWTCRSACSSATPAFDFESLPDNSGRPSSTGQVAFPRSGSARRAEG